MASNCSFGQIPDLRTRSLCIRGKVVVDAARNITGKNLKVTTITNKGSTNTKMVNEQKRGDGIVVANPLFFNLHGICRAYLNTDVKLTDTDSVIINGTAWDASFESFGAGPTLLKQLDNDEIAEHVFKVPNAIQYTNTCLKNWTALVEVNATFTFQHIGFDPNVEEGFSIKLLRNGLEVSTILYRPPQNPTNIPSSSINFHDIVLCFPGDVLDFEFIEQVASGSAALKSGSNKSFATFKILTFQDIPI